MDQTRNYVTICNREVIVWSVNISWDYGRKVTAVFFGICSTQSVNEAFGDCITLIARYIISGWCTIFNKEVSFTYELKESIRQLSKSLHLR